MAPLEGALPRGDMAPAVRAAAVEARGVALTFQTADGPVRAPWTRHTPADPTQA